MSSWRDTWYPVRMQRVALMGPAARLRDVLVRVADEGTVDFDDAPNQAGDGAGSAAAARLQQLAAAGHARAALAPDGPDIDRWERQGLVDFIAGEAQLERRAAQAVSHGTVAGLTGWVPVARLSHLAERVAEVGGAAVALPAPAGVDAPTMLSPRSLGREFTPLVETYGTVPYSDLDPSMLAGIAYVAMFGMMFADVGHGALLLLGAVAVRMGRWSPLRRLRPVWVFLAGAGVASMAFGALYGEFFGPTGVVPVVWLAPLDHPVPLIFAAVGVGAVLLAGAYAVGSVNRFREGGWQRAAYAPSGLAGAALFLGLGAVAAGVYTGAVWIGVIGGTVAAGGVAVAFAGLYAAAGGGGGGAAQAAVELFDLVVRLLSNLVSFARLAAFGLTHAALEMIVWDATTSVAGHGPVGVAAAVVVFAAGNALAFALEGLVAGVQALRLEYYELFSRIYDQAGRPYRPWHVPLRVMEVTP